MQRVQDQKQIEEWVRKYRVQDWFDSQGLEFGACWYEKGEYLAAPSRALDLLMFVVQGTIQIYGVQENGGLLPVNQVDSPTLIGDIEYSQGGRPPFFVEAKTRVLCITLPMSRWRCMLDKDLRFLHRLLQAYIDKLNLFANMDVSAPTVEQRVLLYLQRSAPGGELRGVDAAVLQLRCSRRQLQRTLSRLCAEGRVEKIGKGRYRLCDAEKREERFSD